ncbi:uncharacterized protein LOC126227762 isoform X2 [Schistocerca nitens]|uniref:uncharacterized protein LOC126227762 isoform X2 n=1 Tax=Schistocerca nitens TaxID=7011 RepID=UPI0021184D55|nr:uncharacterized protein LOC126227762 isoform X2 [Schistocerca nitens]XP_049798207.1 uncharacterized protein LOC126227762 isoform X2 [Schistocerca nitens]
MEPENLKKCGCYWIKLSVCDLVDTDDIRYPSAMILSDLEYIIYGNSTQETFTVGCAVENSSPSTPQCSPELFKVGHYATSKKQAKDVLVSSTLSMLRDKQTAMNGSNEDGKLGQCVGAELITTKNRKLKAETKCLITNAIMGAIQKVTDC